MNYGELAVVFAEKYGIIDYTVNGKYLVYYRNTYTAYERFTTKFTVDLDTFSTIESKRLARMNKRGDYNR